MNLLKEFKTIKNIYNADKESLLKVQGIGKGIVDNIVNKDIKNSVEKHLEYMQKNKIEIISIDDERYPNSLRNIYDPPISIYVKGNINILNNQSIAIVGCRNSSNYGNNVAMKFSYNLSSNNVSIISGLAMGIDKYAHLGAIQANGKTIAVLGNGLDTIYPLENKGIANKILQLGGVIISEYPLGTKPLKMNFPARNRIISGMSKGVLVVEAQEKSGTLITVDFAIEQGKEVYVIPGNITSKNSVGTNELIRQGAKLVTDFREILNDM